MYSILKKLVRYLLPEQLLRKAEPSLRRLYGRLLYFGNNRQCNICGSSLRRFIPLSNGDLLCPACGSLGRQRRLWHLLRQAYPLQGRILHFSPARPIYRLLSKASSIEYIASDFAGEFPAAKKYDITNIPETDGSINLLICYHVLEHIPDDRKAMAELYRVLRQGGTALIQTPFREGDIYENPAIQTPADRLQHFGQEDHVRVYSPEGLKARLESVGFSVQLKRFTQTEATIKLGLRQDEIVVIAQRLSNTSFTRTLTD